MRLCGFCATKHSMEGGQGQMCENESGGGGRSVALINAVVLILRVGLSLGLRMDYNSGLIIT